MTGSGSELAIDHVLVAVDDPGATAARYRDRAGLAAVPGGRHVGHGTGNWIVPLGGCYIELLHVVDDDEAADSPLGRWVGGACRNGDRLLGLCVRTDDLDAVATRIGGGAEQMHRDRDDGVRLSWRLLGLDAAMSDDRLPFFIQWDVDDADHPGRMAADHDRPVDGIAWVEYGGDPDRLARRLGDHSLPIRSTDGRPGPRRLAVETIDGTQVITATGPI